jgi:hypothetical protein
MPIKQLEFEFEREIKVKIEISMGDKTLTEKNGCYFATQISTLP